MSENITSITPQVTEAAEENISETKNNEAKDTKDEGIYVHTFKKPFKYENSTYTSITFKFGELKGKDMIAIENEMSEQNEIIIAPEISAGFLCRMAARAGGIGSDVIEALPIGDFSKIKNAARNFLISAGY